METLNVDNIIEEETKAMMFLFENKTDFNIYYRELFNLLRKIFSIYDDEKVNKYANLLIYQLIFHLENNPSPLLVIESIEFCFSNSFYIIKPFWFFGIINPISKMSLFNIYLFNNPKFLTILKTFYSCNKSNVNIRSLISLIYVRYLIFISSVINPLDIWNDIYFFFNPYFKGILEEKSIKNIPGINEYIILLKIFKRQKNWGKFISKISPLIRPVLPYLDEFVIQEFKKILSNYSLK